MLTPLPPPWAVTDDDALHLAARQLAGQRDGAVDAGVGSEGEDHATTTSTPARSIVARSSAVMPASVTKVSISSSAANRSGASTPILLESVTHDGAAGRRPTMARLVAASSRSGVVSPCVAEAVGGDVGHVGAQVGQRGHRVGADGGVGGRPDPARQEVELDVREPRQPGRDRDGVGDDGQPVVTGEYGGQPGRRRAGIDDHHRPGWRQQGDRGGGDRVLGGGVGLVALAEPGLDRGDRAHRHRTAVDAPDQARCGRGWRGRGVRSRWSPRTGPASWATDSSTLLADQLGDGLLSLFGVHAAKPPGSRICVCVVL